ncbi:MAG TPA: flagellar biosynthesis protein FlgA [Candidatus Thioglobus sp.]|jgi:(2R)-sulfolactate sulfo-lyase subunit alpha|nr:flagellar biosynthesis protein FlgA [Candidatus Thioglobus sp.]
MIQFIVHDEDDSVGVVTVEGLNENDTLTGWIMDQDVLIDIKINQDIPIGHKIAIKDLNKDDTVIKYGVDIGRTISQIKVGDHLHVHNVKTKRW